MKLRRETRTWRQESEETEPTPIVQDPVLRAYLKTERRALLMQLTAIEQALGPEPRAPAA